MNKSTFSTKLIDFKTVIYFFLTILKFLCPPPFLFKISPCLFW